MVFLLLTLEQAVEMGQVQANVAAAKLEAYWSQMRLAESEVLGMSLVKVIPASNALA